jgi:hypothetical protein
MILPLNISEKYFLYTEKCVHHNIKACKVSGNCAKYSFIVFLIEFSSDHDSTMSTNLGAIIK